MATRSHHPEILVVGAGPGGATAAWALAQAGHDILLIDQTEFPRDKTCGDGLTPLALKNLAHMGVLQQIEAAGANRIEEVRLVGPFGQSVTMRFGDMFGPENSYALVLPRFTLDNILWQHAVNGGAEYAGHIRVESVERAGDRIIRVIGTGPAGQVEFQPDHVIVAVGAAMGLLKREGFMRHKANLVRAARAYYQNVRTPPNRYEFYLDRDLLPGYGWIFPTGNGIANVGVGKMPSAWASSESTSTLLDSFVQKRASDGSMAGAELVGPVKGYPLRIDFPAQRVAGENWVIVGEATGLVNPATGEGIDLAIESGLLAAEVLHADISTGRGNHTAYQQELWERFGPMFSGLRVLRDITLTPLFADYLLWLMNQHRFLAKTVLNIVLGFEPPQAVFHPLFVVQFFMPISPRFVASQIAGLLPARRQPGVHT